MNFLSKSHTEDIEFQIIFSFVLGIIFAPLSYGIEYTFAFVVLFEIYVFCITSMYPPSVKGIDRININLFFFFGWVLGRIFVCEECGLDHYIILSSN